MRVCARTGQGERAPEDAVAKRRGAHPEGKRCRDPGCTAGAHLQGKNLVALALRIAHDVEEHVHSLVVDDGGGLRVTVAAHIHQIAVFGRPVTPQPMGARPTILVPALHLPPHGSRRGVEGEAEDVEIRPVKG